MPSKLPYSQESIAKRIDELYRTARLGFESETPTKKALAALLGVSSQTLHCYFTGQTPIPAYTALNLLHLIGWSAPNLDLESNSEDEHPHAEVQRVIADLNLFRSRLRVKRGQ